MRPGWAAAEWHLKLGRYEDAFELANRARELTFHEKTQRVLGLVYLHRGDFEKTAFHLGKADADGEVLEGLIRAYLALGNLAEAERSAEQAEKVEPRPASLTAARRPRRCPGRPTQAAAGGGEGTEEQRDRYRSALAWTVCAEDAYRERLPTARTEALLRLAFKEGSRWVGAGPASATGPRRGPAQEGASDAEKAVTLSPNEPRGYTVRGRVRLERGADGAVDDLAKAVELTGRKDGVGLHWLAAALLRAGRTREALGTQQEAFRLLPEDAEVREQLQELERVGNEGVPRGKEPGANPPPAP
jgi:tetratricopeptide (TPR) repeat protein